MEYLEDRPTMTLEQLEDKLLSNLISTTQNQTYKTLQKP